MNEQVSNNRGDSRPFMERYDPRRFLGSLLEPKRLMILYVAVFVALSLYLFPPMQKLKEIEYREGDIADVDVIAPFTFYVPYSEQEIEINKSKAALNVPPIYRENGQATKHLPDDLENFMEMIGEIARRDTLSEDERLALIVGMAPRLGEESARLLLSGTLRRKILDRALRLQAQLLDKGIINNATPLRRSNYPHITVLTDEEEKLAPTTYLVEQNQLEGIILSEAKKIFDRDEQTIKLFYDILRSHLMPNLVYDMDGHKTRRDEAEKSVAKMFKVSENERIIAKHDKITQDQVDILTALEEKRANLELEASFWKRGFLFFSKGLRVSALLLLLGLALYRLRPDLILERDKLTLIYMIILFYLLFTALVIKVPLLDPYLVPVALSLIHI